MNHSSFREEITMTERLFTHRGAVLLFLFLFLPGIAVANEIVHKTYRFTASGDKPLSIRLEADAGEIQIRPGDDPEDVVFNCRYEKRRYELEVNFDEDDNELEIYFDIKKWFKDGEDEERSYARLILELPRDVPIEFYCRTKAGETDIELGGVRLLNARLKMLAGEAVLSFSEPNPERMEELMVETKIGELTIEKMGNANFEYAAVDGSIGEMTIDLSADMEPEFDREVDINLGIGQTRIYIPEEEAVRFTVSKFLFFTSMDIPSKFRRRGKYYYSKNYEEARYKLEISISPGLGTLDIRTR